MEISIGRTKEIVVITKKLVSLSLLVVGVIHLLPVVGVLGGNRLASLYGIHDITPDLEILLRHRSFFFGIIGGFFCYAAFKPHLQASAFTIATLSVLSFLVLAMLSGQYNTFIRRVVVADWIALAVILLGVISYWASRRAA
jgi:hypothetical protein